MLRNRASFHFHRAGKKEGSLWREKCAFRPERNVGKEGQERSAIGNEFQMVGAAKVNERRPFAERMSGTVRRCLSRDRRLLEGVYGVGGSDR